MNHLRQALMGVLVALISILLLLGGFSLALQERDLRLARLAISPTPTPTSPPVTLPEGLTPSPTSSPAPGIDSATQAAVESATCPPPPGWVRINVQRGDTLASLAASRGTSAEEIANGNCLLVDTLPPGSGLYVPAPLISPPAVTPPGEATCGPPDGWVVYTVERNDTIFSLSRAYRTTEEALRLANCLGNSNLIIVGQQIYVPNVPSNTPVATVTPSATSTPRARKTAAPPTPTASPTATAPAPTSTATASPPTPTAPTPSATPTLAPTATDTPTPDVTPTPTPTLTATPTATPTATSSPTPGLTSSPTSTPLPTGTPLPTSSAHQWGNLP